MDSQVYARRAVIQKFHQFDHRHMKAVRVCNRNWLGGFTQEAGLKIFCDSWASETNVAMMPAISLDYSVSESESRPGYEQMRAGVFFQWRIIAGKNKPAAMVILQTEIILECVVKKTGILWRVVPSYKLDSRKVAHAQIIQK